jgi:hypothetical protein
MNNVLKNIAEENDYLDYTEFPNGDNAAIMKLMFTFAILHNISYYSYDDRWCYQSYEEAKKALINWNGEGEPDGWHRHPSTGRRRPDGDKTQETVWF